MRTAHKSRCFGEILDEVKQNTNVRHRNSPEGLEASKLTKLTAPRFSFVDGFERLDQRPALNAPSYDAPR